MGLSPDYVSSTNAAPRAVNQNAEPIPVKRGEHASPSTPEASHPLAAENAPRADKPVVQAFTPAAKATPITGPTDRAKLGKKWSVQVSAEPAKAFADTLVQRLKDNGYDSYAVQAVVKGQTYYRVRVGHLDTQEEAESVRQLLARRGGYRNAYLTAD